MLVGCSRCSAQRVSSVAVLADGRIVSGSDDNTLRVWNPTTGVSDVVLEGHTEVIVAVFSMWCARALVCVRPVEA